MRLLLIAAVLLVYWQSVKTPFTFDDAGAVLNNPTIRRLWSLDVFSPPSDGSTTTGRPLVNLSLALNFAISGTDPWSYHLGNLFIHAAGVLVLFGLLRQTFSRIPLQGVFGVAEGLAFFIALIWAIHPLNTETVICVAQRTESLCALFYLLTLYGFCRGAVRPSSSGWLGLSFFSCLCGMATKEVTVTAPLMVLLYDRTFVAGNFHAAWKQRRRYYCAITASWILLGILLVRGGGARGASAGFGLGVSSWRYLLQQAHAVILYLKLSFWPNPLVLDYGTGVPDSLRDVWIQGFIVLLLLAVTIWALVRKPVLGFIGAWFFIILAPSSGVVPLVTQSMAEHRMYLPLAGIIALVVSTLHYYLPARARWMLGIFVVLGLGIGTVLRNRDYRDGATLWRDTVEKYPSSARGHNNYALELQRLGKSEQANREFQAALVLQPEYILAHYNWGVALFDQGRIDDAVTQLGLAVELAPTYPDAHLNLGNALAASGRIEQAITHYEAALRLQPEAADVHFNLGLALEKIGQREAAVTHLKKALEKRPDLAEAHYQLGRMADESGRLEEAVQHYEETLVHAPNKAAAEASLGVVFARTEQMEKAAIHLERAVKLNPNDPDTLSNLGNVYLLQMRFSEAIAYYEKSLLLRPGDRATLENLRVARESLQNVGH